MPIRVDLLWPGGSDPSAGELVVSSYSGVVLYDVPLAGVDELDAQLPIPSGSEGTPNLDIHLEIDGPSSGTSSSGSYQISIHWDAILDSNSTFNASVPAVFGTTSGFDSVSPVTREITPSPAGITAVGSLPAASPPVPTIIIGPTLAPANGVGTSTPSLFGPFPVPSKIIVVSAIPAATPAPTVPTPASPTTPAPTAPAVEVPSPSVSGSAAGSSSSGSGNRLAVIGPLPLIGSSPDGGIFTYSPSPAKASIDPFRPTITVAPASDKLEMPDPPARRRPIDAGMPFPLDALDQFLAMPRPFALEMAGTSSATGAAFLPPLIQLAEVRAPRPSSREAGSRWPILHAKVRPRSSFAAIVFGSASLLLGLVAPDCATKLAEWREDRRWKRQLIL